MTLILTILSGIGTAMIGIFAQWLFSSIKRNIKKAEATGYQNKQVEVNTRDIAELKKDVKEIKRDVSDTKTNVGEILGILKGMNMATQ